MTGPTFGYGQFGPDDANSPFNAVAFQIQQQIKRLNICKVVQVVAVSSPGGVNPVGTVDVLPLVSQIDGQGNVTPHGTVFGLPYFRLQGGSNAVICDPVKGDIGIAVIADRDISSVTKNKGQSPPGSFRYCDLADGIYIGGILNGTPKQYVEFTSTGITIADMNNNQIKMGLTGITLIGNVIMENNLQLAGQIQSATGGLYSGNMHIGGTLTADTNVVGGGKSLNSHTHSGVQPGSGNTGGPN